MTSLYSDYTQLASYLEGQQFGPKPSVPEPSMSYPLLPQYQVQYGLNSLTHDSNPYTGYYNIESGYGNNKCTTFMVGSCPSNQYIQPFAPPQPPVESFEYNDKDLTTELKKLKIIMFTQDGCKFCKDVVTDLDLKKKCPNLKILNLKDKSNMKLFQMYGGNAVPFFVSTETKKTFTGHPKSLSVLLKHLSEIPKDDLKSVIKDMDIHVLVSDRCGYCRRLTNLINSNGLTDVVRVYRQDDPNVAYVFGKYRYDGVPFIVSMKTGKNITGAPQTISQLLNALY